jgi:hypothetical protein
MAKPIKKAKGKRGRPATGHDPVIAGRVPLEVISAMDAWAEKAGVSRSEAMGLLLAAGLKRPPKL